MAGGLLPSISVPVALRSDEAREERREASAETRAAAEADAQAWANSFASANDRLTPEAARELRARIQQFANARKERFTEQQLTDIMTRVLDHQPPRPGSNDPSVRAAAAEPLPNPEPAVVPHDEAGHHAEPNPNDPNVPTRDLPNSPGADYSRLMKGAPNPNNLPHPSLAAGVPPHGAPPPPPPGAAVPPPPLPGAPLTDGAPDPLLANTPPPPPGTPVASGAPVIPGAPVVPGTPVVPGSVPGEPVAPVRMMSLGEPVRGMTGEEHQDVTTTFVTMRANFASLLSTSRPGTPVPVPTPATVGETIGSRLRNVAERPASKVGRSGSRPEGGRDGEDLNRGLALGFRRSMGAC